ncbi:MAG: hypothetical protein Q9175_004130 [Cornicularia normoerica]
MFFPAAEGPDTETVVEKTSRQAPSAPAWYAIMPDGLSSECVDAPERPLSEIGKMSPASEKATSSQSKKSNSSSVSFTSTIEYNQTSFDQYTHQVKELCHRLWNPSPQVPQDFKTSRIERLFRGADNRVAGLLIPKRSRSARISAPPIEFLIDRLRGGGFNRVIGIKIKHSTDDEPTQFILRVPRFDDARLDREVAVLRFIRQHTTIPVPEVKYVDFTSDNPLKQCYVIHNRIPGYDLQNRTKPTCYLNLNQKQKCTFAKEFALMLLELHDIMHPFPGLIEASADSDNVQKFTVRPFDLISISGYEPELDLNTKLPFFEVRPFVKDWEPPEKTPPEQSTYYFMMAQFGRWKALELRSDPAIICWSKQYDRLVTMAEQMDNLGFLGNDENCVCHLDLLGAPRNIMADIKSDGSLSITGILDWDSAVFAPRFVGCAPPMWLWAWDEEGEDEKHANDTPSNREDQEIKKVFEEIVGDWFLSYAYKPEYRLARELFRFAKSGIRSSTEIEEVEELLKDWTGIYESRTASKEKKAADTEDAPTENATEGESNGSTEIKASQC